MIKFENVDFIFAIRGLELARGGVHGKLLKHSKGGFFFTCTLEWLAGAEGQGQFTPTMSLFSLNRIAYLHCLKLHFIVKAYIPSANIWVQRLENDWQVDLELLIAHNMQWFSCILFFIHDGGVLSLLMNTWRPCSKCVIFEQAISANISDFCMILRFLLSNIS